METEYEKMAGVSRRPAFSLSAESWCKAADHGGLRVISSSGKREFPGAGTAPHGPLTLSAGCRGCNQRSGRKGIPKEVG